MSHSGLWDAAVLHAAPGPDDTEVAAVLCSQGAVAGLPGFSLGAV